MLGSGGFAAAIPQVLGVVKKTGAYGFNQILQTRVNGASLLDVWAERNAAMKDDCKIGDDAKLSLRAFCALATEHGVFGLRTADGVNAMAGVDLALAVTASVAAAAGTLQTAGLVHRDIKPENVMVDVNGRVWLIDLGSACAAFDQERTKTVASQCNRLACKCGEKAGTYGFISGRTMLASLNVGKNAEMCPMATLAGDDSTSLGALLVELLTDGGPGSGGASVDGLLTEYDNTIGSNVRMFGCYDAQASYKEFFPRKQQQKSKSQSVRSSIAGSQLGKKNPQTTVRAWGPAMLSNFISLDDKLRSRRRTYTFLVASAVGARSVDDAPPPMAALVKDWASAKALKYCIPACQGDILGVPIGPLAPLNKDFGTKQADGIRSRLLSMTLINCVGDDLFPVIKKDIGELMKVDHDAALLQLPQDTHTAPVVDVVRKLLGNSPPRPANVVSDIAAARVALLNGARDKTVKKIAKLVASAADAWRETCKKAAIAAQTQLKNLRTTFLANAKRSSTDLIAKFAKDDGRIAAAQRACISDIALPVQWSLTPDAAKALLSIVPAWQVAATTRSEDARTLAVARVTRRLAALNVNTKTMLEMMTTNAAGRRNSRLRSRSSAASSIVASQGGSNVPAAVTLDDVLEGNGVALHGSWKKTPFAKASKPRYWAKRGIALSCSLLHDFAGPAVLVTWSKDRVVKGRGVVVNDASRKPIIKACTSCPANGKGCACARLLQATPYKNGKPTEGDLILVDIVKGKRVQSADGPLAIATNNVLELCKDSAVQAFKNYLRPELKAAQQDAPKL